MGAPTSYYYAMRSELFLRDAQKALAQGEKERHLNLMMRATQYQHLAGFLPLEEGTNEQDICTTQVLQV